MKLIKQTTLHYREGNSDKIYEVDLCQVGDRYVVNFRYGRRGSNLQEGVKTTQPVPLAEAQKIFDKLLAEKVKKGYRDVTVSAASQTDISESVAAETREQAILNQLVKAGSKKWPLERVIWRAGELKIREATPLLISFIGSGSALRDYCIAGALGWCGGEGAIDAVSRLYHNSSKPEFVRRIAFEALLKLADEQAKTLLRAEKLEQLPPELRNLARNGSATELLNALRAYLDSRDYKRFAVLDTLYHVDNEFIRPALLEILRTAPLRPNYFQRIRHIFKIAEYRLDAEVFGTLAYRFEKETAMFRPSRWDKYTWDKQSRTYVKRADYLSLPDSNRAYSSLTRDYLLRRTWRSLRKLGSQSDPNYVKMASAVLLPYTDADAESVRQSKFYDWRSGSGNSSVQIKDIDWDIYAGYLTFNHILYENSPRYLLAPNSKAWRCREGYKPGNPPPEVREEAFPELWQQQPDELLHLILESKCHRVHEFAVKVLRTCQQFLAELDANAVIKIVERGYNVTVQLGLELARERYNPSSPNKQLILALANTGLLEARSQAYQWIEEQREIFLQDINFIAALVISKRPETRQFAREFLSSSILSDTLAKALIGRIIAELLALPLAANDLAESIGEMLLVNFAPQLRSLGLPVVRDLLDSPMPALQIVGARILLSHETPAANLPLGWIDSLLNSPHSSLREIGVRLFSQLSDEMLLERYELLAAMAIHELADMRNAIRPVLHRLANDRSDFGTRLAVELIGVLLTPEEREGVHSYAVQLLKEDLPGWMPNIPREIVWRLLRGKSTAAQELAGVVLRANSSSWAGEFETAEIVKLGDREILAVREAAREMLMQIRDRLHENEEELLAAVRILESKWDDSRQFGQRFFSDFFTAVDFTPTVLVSLCDSVRDEVRAFGRNMVTRHFQEENGPEYLLKFSEHPSTDMQLFATNYLESYAAGDAEKLQELTPFFISILSRVNKGGVAKRRVFAFLDAEALKNEAAALVVAEILARCSATIAIGDKAAAIQTMVKIHRAYPHIPLPIQVKPVSNRMKSST